MGSGPQQIVLMAHFQPDTTLAWSLEGPGQLLGDMIWESVLYAPPASLEQSPQRAVITLDVSDAQGNRGSTTIVFELLGASEKVKTATLTLRSNVNDDHVTIDGKPYGATRLDVELPLGTHVVRIEKQGYSVFEQEIDLQKDQIVKGRLRQIASGNVEPLPGFECSVNSDGKQECVDPFSKIAFIYVPGGCFQMGTAYPTKEEELALIEEHGLDNYQSVINQKSSV